MNILSVSTYDVAGGAEKIAYTLHVGYKDLGHCSRLLVGTKNDELGDAVAIVHDKYRSSQARLFISCSNLFAFVAGERLGRLRTRLKWCGQRARQKAIARGEEDLDFPGTQHILDSCSELPDIVHCHNLHGNYFDLRYLAELSKKLPVVMTLHDTWTITGHCGYYIDCNRWKTGCGNCPDLNRYPSVSDDATAINWNRKKDIFADCSLYVVTPSKWLLTNVEQSILAPAIVESKVINNGIDLSIFNPGSKAAARERLGIHRNAKVLLFTAHGMRKNKYKDFQTISEAIALVSSRLPEVDLQFLAVGEMAKQENVGGATITFVPYSSDPKFVASHYQAADIYLHAANSDNFPTTVLEALACGTPVVATAVDGIPEQIADGVTGFLTPPKDPESMAKRIIELLNDDLKRDCFGRAAAKSAEKRFDSNLMVENYLDFFKSVLARNSVA